MLNETFADRKNMYLIFDLKFEKMVTCYNQHGLFQLILFVATATK